MYDELIKSYQQQRKYISNYNEIWLLMVKLFVETIKINWSTTIWNFFY